MIPNSRTEKPSPESVLLDILSRKPKLTSKEAFGFFLAKYKPGMTIQGFYKLIRQLLRDRVIVKDSGTLSLNIGWIQNLVQFTDNVKQTYLADEITKRTIILDEGEKNTFTFDRVVEMDDFWDHALLTILYYYQDREHKDKNAYSKNYYSWIQVLRTKSEVALVDSFTKMKTKWYMASGSHSLLNSLVSNVITAPNFNYKIYEKLDGYGMGKDNFHVTVIGDFIFETEIPNYIFQTIKNVFETAQYIADFNTENIKNLIREPARTKLTLSRDRERANSIREEIKNIFKKTK